MNLNSGELLDIIECLEWVALDLELCEDALFDAIFKESRKRRIERYMQLAKKLTEVRHAKSG